MPIHEHAVGVNTVTAAREMSQRGQDLGMMEQRLLIFARKVRSLAVQDRRSLASKQLESSILSFTNSLPSLVQKSLFQPQCTQLAHPSNYHILPPPQFEGQQICIVMGDPSLSCREKLNGIWNPEDFETRRKLVEALLNAGYRPDQVCYHRFDYRFVYLTNPL
jgi:hypothetical protein